MHQDQSGLRILKHCGTFHSVSSPLKMNQLYKRTCLMLDICIWVVHAGSCNMHVKHTNIRHAWLISNAIQFSASWIKEWKMSVSLMLVLYFEHYHENILASMTQLMESSVWTRNITSPITVQSGFPPHSSNSCTKRIHCANRNFVIQHHRREKHKQKLKRSYLK